MPKITITHLFSGMGDYWGGDGRRWDDDAGCLFAHYDTNTTLRDLVDGWVNDFCAGGDCDSLPDDLTESDVRAAIVDCLTPAGRATYDTGGLSDESEAYAEANGLEAGVPLDDQSDEDDWGESPVSIILIECDICSECGAWAEHAEDDICDACLVKRAEEDRDDPETYDNHAAFLARNDCVNADDEDDWDDCDDCTDCENCAVKHGYAV